MGNVCCSYNKLDFPDAEGKGRGTNRITPEKDLLSSSGSEVMDPSAVSVIAQLGKPALEEIIKQAQDTIANRELCTPKTRLINERHKMFDNEYTFWADFSELPSGNRKHMYRHQLEYPFTPELFFLYSLQQNLESFSKVDDSLDQMEVLNYAALDDIFVMVTKTKTKKILVVEPRSFLVLRVIKRISPTHFIEAQKSVQITGLKDQEPWASLISKQQNLGEIEIAGSEVKTEDGKTLVRTLANVDVLSSTGPMILKPILKGKFSRYHKNTVKEALRFAFKTKEGEFKDLKWFTNDPAELTRILEENRRLTREKRPNLNDLDKEEASDLYRLMNDSSAGTDKEKQPLTGDDSLHVHNSGVAAERKPSDAKPPSRKASEVKLEAPIMVPAKVEDHVHALPQAVPEEKDKPVEVQVAPAHEAPAPVAEAKPAEHHEVDPPGNSPDPAILKHFDVAETKKEEEHAANAPKPDLLKEFDAVQAKKEEAPGNSPDPAILGEFDAAEDKKEAAKPHQNESQVTATTTATEPDQAHPAKAPLDDHPAHDDRPKDASEAAEDKPDEGAEGAEGGKKKKGKKGKKNN